MKKIYLSLNSFELGYLTRCGEGFEFVANQNEINQAKNENNMTMNLFNLNCFGKKKYENIPQVFKQFDISKERTDVINKANISENDDYFERLFKLAGLNSMPINFKIHQ